MNPISLGLAWTVLEYVRLPDPTTGKQAKSGQWMYTRQQYFLFHRPGEKPGQIQINPINTTDWVEVPAENVTRYPDPRRTACEDLEPKKSAEQSMETAQPGANAGM